MQASCGKTLDMRQLNKLLFIPKTVPDTFWLIGPVLVTIACFLVDSEQPAGACDKDAELGYC